MCHAVMAGHTINGFELGLIQGGSIKTSFYIHIFSHGSVIVINTHIGDVLA